MAVTDPDRAARIATDTERIARALTEDDEKATALAFIAEAVAVADAAGH